MMEALRYLGYQLDADFVASLSDDGSLQITWVNGTPPPDMGQVQSAIPAAEKAAKTSKIKAGARARILARLPEWKQANMTARAVELVALGQTSGAEWAAMQTAWDWIKAVRAHSDVLELAVIAADDPASVDIELGWPE